MVIVHVSFCQQISWKEVRFLYCLCVLFLCAMKLHCCPKNVRNTWNSQTVPLDDILLYHNECRQRSSFWVSPTNTLSCCCKDSLGLVWELVVWTDLFLEKACMSDVKEFAALTSFLFTYEQNGGQDLSLRVLIGINTEFKYDTKFGITRKCF